MIEASPELLEGIVQKIKTNGMFDEMRRDCLADIDTKPAFQNLKQRVENFVNTLLSNEVWTPSLNKNQLRTKVRTSVIQSGMLNTGIEHILHQVVDAKMYTQFLPKISDFIEENREDLKKEFLPVVEQNEVDQFQAAEEESAEDEFQPPPPLLVGEEESNQVSQETEEIKPNEVELEDETKSDANIESNESVQTPVIPEGAASTLRNLIQSLMGSGIQNLLAKEEADENIEDRNIGKSPSIDPADIEAFTDESRSSDVDLPSHAGPRTPPASGSDQDNEDTPHPEHFNESEHEDEGDSNPENIARHSDEKSEQSNDEVEKFVYSSSGKEENESEKADLEIIEKEANIVDVNEVYEENNVEVVEIQEESILVEECIMEENSQEEYEEVVMVDEMGNQQSQQITEGEELPERKKKHKRHHKRRHRSSTEDSSNDSGQIESSAGSERIETDEEIHQSKSRKKKRKKRSKKHKRQKLKSHNQSPHGSVSRDERPGSSSEYLRSSLSPTQRRPFMSPQDERSLRLEGDMRGVKVEPVFLPQMTTRFREPYALGYRDADNVPPDIERGPHHSDVFRPRYSPPHPYMHPHFPPPPRFPARPPFHGHSPPPPRRYSPTYDFYRAAPRPGFEPPRSPPPNRRFSPPRPGMFPFGPPDDRGPMHGPRGHRPYSPWPPP